MVHSPCPRLYIAAAVAINTTFHGLIRTFVLSHCRPVHDVITIYTVNVKYTACFTARRCASAVFAVDLCLFVRLSVCPSQAGIVSKQLDESSWFLARRLPSTDPTLCCKEIWVSPKVRVVPCGTSSETPDLKNGKSIGLSTKLVVVVVDGRAC